MSVRVSEVVGEVKGDSSVAVSIKGGVDVVSRDAFVALGMGRNGAGTTATKSVSRNAVNTANGVRRMESV